MNETLWLACRDPLALLSYLEGKASDRKLRLFACACARRFWRQLLDGRCRDAVETAERHADGLAGVDELAAAREAADLAALTAPMLDAPAYRAAVAAAAETAIEAAQAVVDASRAMAVRDAAYGGVPGPDERRAVQEAIPVEAAVQCDVLRHVLGNPFRPTPIDPGWLRWRDGCVGKMAAAAYDERRFEELPLLADALEDAGCEDAAVLAHLRASIAHSRGCWAIDALLKLT